MLSFDIHRDDIAGPWSSRSGAWTSGASEIRPLPHPALEAASLETIDATLLIVRERQFGPARAATPADAQGLNADTVIARLLDTALNVQIVELPKFGRSGIRVATGRGATAPLFLLGTPERVRAHWDVAALYPALEARVDFAALAYALTHFGLPYSSRTIFPSIRQLTERAEAEWRPGLASIAIRDPEPLRPPAARTLKPGADVHGAFAGLVQDFLRTACPPGETVATELSGGLDSGVATILLADTIGARLTRSYGLLLPGPRYAAQAERRTEIAARLGIEDVAIDAVAPFCRGSGDRDDPGVPWGEYYREAFFDLSRRIAEDGCRIVVRGIGGDEISELSQAEYRRLGVRAPDASDRVAPMFLTAQAAQACREFEAEAPRAPPSLMAPSFHVGAAASAPVYLRRGIWPIYPYGQPDILTFCLSLPFEWRSDRQLQRSFLKTRGFGDEVVRPSKPETFLPLRDAMFDSPSIEPLRALLRDPLLAQLGLVDRTALAGALDECVARRGGPQATHLLETATMEATLRKAFGEPAPA